MTPRLVLPGADEPVYHLRQAWYVLGTTTDIPLEVVSDEARSALELFTSVADRLLVETPTSSGFLTLGTYPSGGVELGAFTAGQRKTITIRVSIASGVSAALQLLALKLGTGVN